MTKRMVGIISLCFLLIAYFVFRYLLFPWHGMKQFPLYLLIVGLLVIAASGIIKGNRIAPIFTTAGYIAGFFGGYLLAALSFDPGGGMGNNMWLIWMGVYVAAIAVGVLFDRFSGKKCTEQ